MDDILILSKLKDIDWKSLIIRNMGRCYLNKWWTISSDIVSIIFKIKPAFIYDYRLPNHTCLHHLISEINSYLGSPTLLVLYKINSDYIVANKSYLIDCIHKNSTVYVDISATLTNPKIMDNISIIQNIDHHIILNISNDQSYIVFQDNDIYVPSIFGRILGYPVVYWCDHTEETILNCELDVVKVNFRLDKALNIPPIPHLVYSYSYPSDMKSTLSVVINNWVGHINTNLQQLETIFSDININFEEILLPLNL